MTIETAYVPISYAGNNVTNSFAITFDYQESSQIVANTEVVATGVITPLVYGTDFTITPTVNSPASFGTLTLLLGALPSGTNILITRVTDVTQDTSWINNSANPASAFENAVDKLTMIDQEILQGGGTLPDSALGSGTATTDTFLRGGSPRTWSNTLVGPLGAFTLPADTTALLVAGQSGDASIKVVGGASSQSAFSFGVDGSSSPWDARWVYDPSLPAIGWQYYGGSIVGTFTSTGLDVTGTVNATLFTGAADGSLITTGTVDPNRLGSGSPNSNKVLYGDSVWRIVSGGGGGINTTTTGTFTIAAVTSTQTVPVTSATGIVAGTYLQISDGTHTIIGHVTVVASLNLTFVTDSIVAGSAGNTMAGGAAVQSSTVPGNNTIFVEDGDSGSVAVQTLDFTGSNAGAVGNFVKLFIGNISGPVAQIEGYIDPAALSYNVFGTSGGGAGFVAYNSGSTSTLLHPTAANQVPICTLFAGSPITIGWGLIGAANITPASLTPVLLNATNSLTNGYVPSYDSGTGHFTWVANGGSIPGGGDAGKFFRGDNTFSQILDISLDSNPAGLLLAQGTANGNFGTALGTVIDGTQSYWVTNKKVTGTWTSMTGITTNYIVGDLLQHAVLSSQGPWFSIDGTFVENFYSPGIMRTGAGLRSVYGPLSKIYENDAPAASLTIDLVNGSYQRLTNFVNSVSITLADTTPVPTLTSNAYESELTLEISRIQSTFVVDITWPGTITWVNGGSAPTVANGGLQATGFNIIRLVRVQNTAILNGGGARWFGIVENRQTGSGTVTSVATGTGLTGGPITTTGTIAVATGGITASLIANNTITSAQISASANIPTTALALPGGTTTFLAANGTWLVPPGTGGGGGGGPTLAGTQTWTGVNTYTNVINTTGANTFTTAMNTFSRTYAAFNSSTASVKVCGAYPNLALSDASGIEIGINDNFDNDFGGLGDVGVGALGIRHVCTSNSGNNGKASTRFDFILNQSLDTLFSVGHTQITAAKRMNGGIADAVWLNTWGPDSNFSASADSSGTIHEFNSGVMRIGEVNYGNAWGDFGFYADRGGGKVACGLEFFPDWLVYDGVGGDTAFVKYNVSWGMAIGAAGQNPAQPTHHDARNWIGLLISSGAIVGSTDHAAVIGPGGTGSTAGGGGYGIQLHGNPTGNPIGKAINILDYMDVGIDISEATITAEAVSGHANLPAIQLLSGQAICFKAPTGANTGVYIWFDGTNLVASKNGGSSKTTIV